MDFEPCITEEDTERSEKSILYSKAQRRNISLDIIIPQKLPHIVTEPKILNQALNGLMERFIRSLPSGDNFKVLILPVGKI